MNSLLFIYEMSERKPFLYLLLTVLLGFFASGCAVSLPILLKKMIDLLTIHPQFHSIMWIFLLYVVTMLLERFFNEIQFITYVRWQINIVTRVYHEIFQWIFFSKPHFFTQHLPGSITSKISQAMTGLEALMFDGIFKIIPTLVGFILVLCSTAMVFDVNMSLIIGAGALIYCYVMFKFSGKLITVQNSIRNSAIHAQGVTTDLIQAWKDIKLTRSHRFARNTLKSTMQTVIDQSARFYKKRGIYGFVQSLPIVIVYIAANYYAIVCYVAGQATIGSIVLINAYLVQILRPLESLSLLLRGVTKNYSDFIGIHDILDLEKEMIFDDAFIWHIHNISIHNLHIAGILNDINLSINRGEKIAIIGPSGSGKTTLLNVIAGLITDYSGEVFINGIDLKNISSDTIRFHIAYLTSDARLIKETIKNNLSVGKNIDVMPGLQFCGMTEKVASLTQTIDFVVNENAASLSAGELQRLKIARQHLLYSAVDLYDESTSALNRELEEEIIDRILANKHKTTIFVTHKTHFLHKFDRVFRIEKGCLIQHVQPVGNSYENHCS